MFADFDGDAVVDLFVGNGHTSYTMADQLFWGRGDGRFDLDTGALASPPAQPTNGAVACDIDSDGDLDIFVGSYGVSVAKGHNQLWRNDGGVFTDIAGAAGVAALPTGNPLSGPSDYGAADQAGGGPEDWVGTNTFGVDCGDVDNDGDLDLVFASISHLQAPMPLATGPTPPPSCSTTAAARSPRSRTADFPSMRATSTPDWSTLTTTDCWTSH